MTKNYKDRILKAVKARLNDYDSQQRFAKVLGINPAQLSTILKGKTDQVLSDAKWMSIARRLDVKQSGAGDWKTAKTPVYQYVYKALADCQHDSLSGLLCDRADIGKTYTALQYVRENKNAVYIDCSQVKTRQRLIRRIARELGLNHNGLYADIYEDLVFYLRNGIESPLIILDEAGDLDSKAFLELKALWNATEHVCGWYMMGADGLKAKIQRNLNLKTVGYTELFSRYGNRYQKVVPDGKQDADEFVKAQIAIIAKVNGASNIQEMYAKSGGSLRRIYTEVQKMKRNEQSPERNAID